MVVSILYQSLGGNFGLVNVFAPNGGLDNNAMVMGLYVYKYGYSGLKLQIGYSYAKKYFEKFAPCHAFL